MAKKVNLTGKPTSRDAIAEIDAWVQGASGQREVMKRLTIDLPESLHRRVRVQSVQQGLSLAKVVRDFLNDRFPEDRKEE